MRKRSSEALSDLSMVPQLGGEGRFYNLNDSCHHMNQPDTQQRFHEQGSVCEADVDFIPCVSADGGKQGKGVGRHS